MTPQGYMRGSLKMAIQKKINGLRELCDALNIEFELLKAVQENKEFVSHQLLSLNALKTISEVVQEFIEYLRKNVKLGIIKAKTAESYIHFLRPFLQFIEKNYKTYDISKLDIVIFNEYLITCKSFKNKDAVTAGTKNTYLKFIRKMLYFALDNGYLFLKDGEYHIKNKFRWARIPREPRCIPDELVKRILRASTFTKNPYRNHAILCTLLATGARVDELVNIKINDVNFEKDFIKLTGKYRKTRLVTLYPLLKKVLLAYLDLRQISNLTSDQYLFTTSYRKKENGMTKSSVQKMIFKLFKDIGYANEYSTHCFRHTFAVNCLKAGMKIEYIAELMGHEHIETTMIYTTMLSEDLLKEVQKYPIPLEEVLFTLLGVED